MQGQGSRGAVGQVALCPPGSGRVDPAAWSQRAGQGAGVLDDGPVAVPGGRAPGGRGEWIARFLGRGDLAPLGADDLAVLVEQLSETRYAAGAGIFHHGDAPTRVHVVRSGAVALCRTGAGRRVVFQVLRPGDAFGDVPVFVRMLAPFDAVAIEDTVVLSIDSVAFFGLLERRPALACRWLVSLALRTAGLQGRLADLRAGNLEAQVASLLVREASRDRVRLSQSLLAELLGARRTSVNRILKRLEARGLVRLGYRQVTVVDRGALAQLAGGGKAATTLTLGAGQVRAQ